MGANGSKQWATNRDELIKYLQLATHRAALLKSKHTNELAGIYLNIKTEIGNGKDAKLKAEEAIYKERVSEALDELVNVLNLLITRKHLLTLQGHKEIIPLLKTVVYCAGKFEIPELDNVRAIIENQFGRAFVQSAQSNRDPSVDNALITLLSPSIPTPTEVKEKISSVLAMYSQGKSVGTLKGNDCKVLISGSDPKNKEFEDLLDRVNRLKHN